MNNIFFQGENILVRVSVVDKTQQPVPYEDLTDIIVKVTDTQGNSQTFSKLGASIVPIVGTINQYEFELTEGMTQIFSGKLSAQFTYILPSSAYASGRLIDIVQEGVSNDFITLQDQV
jgi:hypothetical protein